MGPSRFEPRSPRSEITQVLKRSNATLRLTKLMLVAYVSDLFTASFIAIVFRSREASGDVPPLQLKMAGVKVPFSTSIILAL